MMKNIIFLTVLALFVSFTMVPFPNVAFAQDELLPTLSINDLTVVDDVGVADFTVTLSSTSSFPVNVDYSTADGTAIAGSDYTAVSGTLIFPAGVTTGTISVPIVGDINYYEFNETFFLNLANPVNATISDGQGIGTIADTPLTRCEDNGHYYQSWFFYPECQWYKADADAQAASFHGVHGYLATIHSAMEQSLCNELRQNAQDITGKDQIWWIGLRRDDTASPWYWITGEPYDPASPSVYSYFYGSEGYDNEGLFACMKKGAYDEGRWYSEGNGVLYYAQGFVIEYPDPPPTADAGESQSVIVGTQVCLDGGNSSDPDGDYPLAFSWEISENPEGSTAALSDTSSVTPSFTPDQLGTYVIRLAVTDSYGAESDTDEVTIQVLSPDVMVETLIGKVVDNTDIPEAIKTSLIASLDTSLKVLNDSNLKNDVAAINALEAFINKVEAQSGKKIPVWVADELIIEAGKIIVALSGGT